jgi:hypothetical protein
VDVVVLNGAVNAGKSTTGRQLATVLHDARFVDGDDHNAPDGTPFDVMLELAISRIEREIAACTASFLVVAYPLRDEDHERVRAATLARGGRLTVVTLAPPVEVATVDRGARRLKPGEAERSRQMYAEGYASRSFSDLIVTEMTGPADTAERIARHFAWR